MSENIFAKYGPFKFAEVSKHGNRIAIIDNFALVTTPSGHHFAVDLLDLNILNERAWVVSKHGNKENRIFYVRSNNP